MPAPLTTSFAVPTLEEAIARVAGDLQATLAGTDPFAPGSDEWALSRVVGGVNYLQHGFLEAILRELFVGSASQQNLERIGGIWGVLRNQPTGSRYEISATSSDATTVPAATLLTSASGVEFETDAEVVFTGAETKTITITSNDTGTDCNLDVGAALTFAAAIPDMDAEATVSSEVEAAADLEDLEAYRSRILHAIQNRAQGGALADYVGWALDVDGVTRAWADSPSWGKVRVVFEGAPSGATVEAGIVSSGKPVTAILIIVQGTGYQVSLDLQVKRETGYDAGTVTTNIEAALTALFDRQGAPSTTIRNSELRQAVANAAGVDYFILDAVVIDGAPGTANDDATTPYNQWHALDAADLEGRLTWL